MRYRTTPYRSYQHTYREASAARCRNRLRMLNISFLSPREDGGVHEPAECGQSSRRSLRTVAPRRQILREFALVRKYQFKDVFRQLHVCAANADSVNRGAGAPNQAPTWFLTQTTQGRACQELRISASFQGFVLVKAWDSCFTQVCWCTWPL